MRFEHDREGWTHALIDIFLIIAGLLLLCVTTLWIKGRWGALDDIRIPRSFTFLGRIETESAVYGQRRPLIVNLAAGWIFYAAMVIMAKYPQVWSIGTAIPKEVEKTAVLWIRHILCGGSALLSLYFCAFVWAAAAGKAMFAPLKLIVLVLMILLLLLGVFKIGQFIHRSGANR